MNITDYTVIFTNCQGGFLYNMLKIVLPIGPIGNEFIFERSYKTSMM